LTAGPGGYALIRRSLEITISLTIAKIAKSLEMNISVTIAKISKW